MSQLIVQTRRIVIDHSGRDRWQDERLKWSDLHEAAVTFAQADLRNDEPTLRAGPVNENAVHAFVTHVVYHLLRMKGVRWFVDRWSSDMNEGVLLYVKDEELLWLRDALKRVQPPAFVDESDAAVWDGKRDGILTEIRYAIEENVWRFRKHREE